MKARAWHYRDGDSELIGELYDPPQPNGQAVLVVHEADGIGGNVRHRCAMLAELGYIAAAADIHGGGRVLSDAEIPAALAAFREDPPRLRRRAGAALEALREVSGLPPRHIAAIGYCFGGMTVLELARGGADLAAVASFHGPLSTRAPAPAGGIKARVFAGTGALDPLVPSHDVAAFQAEMTASGADWHLFVHGLALHSYTNAAVDRLRDPRMAYDPIADRLSWAAFMGFLDEGWRR